MLSMKYNNWIHNYLNFQHNISKEERGALNELKNSSDIIIKQADKGGRWVIMKSYYKYQIIMDGYVF